MPAVAPSGAAQPAAVSEAAPTPLRRGTPVVVEALGYLGGVLAATGVVLLVAHYWTDMAVGGQVALSGITAAALFAGGLATPEGRDPALARLRAFLWTLSTASVAVLASVVARELLEPAPTSRVVAVAATAAAITSGLMWRGRPRPIQQLVALAAGVVAVGATVDQVAAELGTGLAIWLAGAVILGLGIRSLTTAPAIDVLVGSVAVAVGSVIAVADDPGAGLLFVLATGLALVVLALLPQLVEEVASIVVLAVVGGFLVLQSLPPTVGHFADGAAVPTGVAVWAFGLGVVAVAIDRLTRAPIVLEVLGAVVMLAGCAVTALDEPAVATLFGLGTSVALLGVAMLPGRVALSPVGALGLLVYVPWTIGWFFPGEGRVPLLISVAGVLIVGVAVLMARLGHRFGSELGRRPGPGGPRHLAPHG